MAQQSSADGTEALSPLCRFGVNAALDSVVTDITYYDTTPLRMGWYIDYAADATPSRPNGADYTQMIRLAKNQSGVNTPSLTSDGIRTVVGHNPGSVWFIGNEIDRRYWQDDVLPEVYATLYHDLYHEIKQLDPTARIFPGSIVQATAVRLEYLDLILAHYYDQYGVLLPADGWSLHGFVLNEVDPENNPDGLGFWGASIPPGIDDSTGLVIHDDVYQTLNLDLFRQHIEDFRVWMAENGYGRTPLYLSEYGVLIPEEGFDPPFDADLVNEYMNQTFDYLLTATDATYGYALDNNRLVQRLSWFSTNYPPMNGDLFSETDRALSEIGQNYAQYTQGRSEETDFQPTSLFTRPVAIFSDDAPVDLTLIAEIANAGNNQNRKSTSVNFYQGDPDAGGALIDSQTVTLKGCGEKTIVELAWPGVTPDEYDIFVTVEAVEGDIESGNDNNTTYFRLLHNPQQIFLPMTNR